MIFNLDKCEHLTVSNICTELTPIVFTKCLIQNIVVIINYYLSWGDHIRIKLLVRLIEDQLGNAFL